MWHAPKKYSIKRISFNSNQFYITIKESYKKLPWKGFTGEHIYSFNGQPVAYFYENTVYGFNDLATEVLYEYGFDEDGYVNKVLVKKIEENDTIIDEYNMIWE